MSPLVTEAEATFTAPNSERACITVCDPGCRLDLLATITSQVHIELSNGPFSVNMSI
jgi:hypothetical protein